MMASQIIVWVWINYSKKLKTNKGFSVCICFALWRIFYNFTLPLSQIFAGFSHLSMEKCIILVS